MRMKILLALVALFVFPAAALAVPNDDSTGPEGPNAGTPINNPHFQINISATNAPIHEPFTSRDTYQQIFPLAQGWDFGDRVAYTCAWVEYFQGQNEKFELAYHGIGAYPNFYEINDKFGAELQDDPTLSAQCLAESGVANRRDFRWDGSDHFPHMIHPGDGLDFYHVGETEPFRHLELSTAPCEKLYFVPGDDAGESWLWWDEDGPTFSHGPGEGELNCGGGPIEPVALIQLEVRSADPDIGYCTHSMHEETCFNVEQPPTPVQLGPGRSVLTCPDGSTPVVKNTDPLIVRC